MVNPGQPITDSLDLRWLYWHSELAVQTILPQQIVMLLKKFISLHSSQQQPSASWLGVGLLRPFLIILKCDWLMLCILCVDNQTITVAMRVFFLMQWHYHVQKTWFHSISPHLFGLRSFPSLFLQGFLGVGGRGYDTDVPFSDEYCTDIYSMQFGNL